MVFVYGKYHVTSEKTGVFHLYSADVRTNYSPINVFILWYYGRDWELIQVIWWLSWLEDWRLSNGSISQVRRLPFLIFQRFTRLTHAISKALLVELITSRTRIARTFPFSAGCWLRLSGNWKNAWMPYGFTIAIKTNKLFMIMVRLQTNPFILPNLTKFRQFKHNANFVNLIFLKYDYPFKDRFNCFRGNDSSYDGNWSTLSTKHT